MRILGLLSFFILSSFAVQAQQAYTLVEDMTDFNMKMEKIASVTETIQCAFNQEKQLSFMDQKMISEGNLYFSGTNKLRWEYVEPYNYAVLMVNDQLTIIDEGAVNETKMGKNPAFKKVQQLLTSTLKGDFKSQQAMFNQRLEENDIFYRMTLTPKDKSMQEFVSTMEVYFSKIDFMLSQFVMDENGDITKTVFSEQKINQQLPEGIFSW